MILKVANTLSEIIEGWKLVYQQYVKLALIDSNPFSVFTYPEYLSRNSAVILGKVGDRNVCSISAVLDSRQGLPLDACFHHELDELRKEKKKLIEIGLLASLSETASPFYIIELLSSIAHFGAYSNYHDYVIGVHPRRAKFLQKLFGFNQVGAIKKYHKLHDSEVILLHAGAQEFETHAKKAIQAIYVKETDLKFENRFRFIRLASLLPFKAVIYMITFFIKLWQKIYQPKRREEFSPDTITKEIVVTSDASVKSETMPGNELHFQSINSLDAGNNLHSEKEKLEMILKSVQSTFNLTNEDLEAMMDGEHFSHQY